ncbi:hypothetical protein KPH14_010423 [Odynerus spinipes]|uniref:Farnesyl pyrophosphate synthase n=1 Tax=Odynerus spinipes TaxID=1348599 RepID=A0AAD9VSW1_9HYME|nr:hypothetical protein KPH14_010423 [Odynerus spinipes]
MSLSSGVGRRFFALCGNGFYRKAEFATLGKIFEREPSRKITQTSFRLTSAEIRMAHTMVKTTWVTSKDETRELMAVWPDVVRDLTEAGRHLDIPDVTKWMAKVLQYNVPAGKKTRALTLVYAYRTLIPPDQLTEENIRLTRILGWCMEMLHAFFLILDDIQDGSQIRRNQPCWYLQNNIGLAAVNDGLMLESAIYQLLRTHLKGKDCYLEIMELLQETTMKTVMGQCLDLLSTNFGYYTFVLPVTVAMYLADIRDPEMHRQAKTILLEMGHFFQVQDDFLDSYGDPEVTGKNGTDIQEGKCTWLIVVALQRATPEQRKILEACYGSKDPEKVKLVKRLYNDIGLPNTYSIYEEETYNLLNTHIQQISRGLPHDLFLNLLEKIYRRVS